MPHKKTCKQYCRGPNKDAIKLSHQTPKIMLWICVLCYSFRWIFTQHQVTTVPCLKGDSVLHFFVYLCFFHSFCCLSLLKSFVIYFSVFTLFSIFSLMTIFLSFFFLFSSFFLACSYFNFGCVFAYFLSFNLMVLFLRGRN